MNIKRSSTNIIMLIFTINSIEICIFNDISRLSHNTSAGINFSRLFSFLPFGFIFNFPELSLGFNSMFNSSATEIVSIDRLLFIVRSHCIDLKQNWRPHNKMFQPQPSISSRACLNPHLKPIHISTYTRIISQCRENFA